MRAYRLAYDGRPFHGFQRQPDVRTVEGSLLDALVALGVTDGGTPPGYAAAGRTDAGVSAVAQTVAFAAPDWLSPAALGSELPDAVRPWAVASVPDGFHATHDAVERSYVYHLHAPRDRTDDDAVAAAVERLNGEHDLHNLTPDDDGTVRDLTLGATRRGAFLAVRATAGGFARQLVRRLVGLLDEVARGVAGPDRVERVLGDDPLDGPAGVAPAAPEPLVLVRVTYPGVGFEADPEAAGSARAAFRDRRTAARAAARTAGTVLDGLPE
ncbi:MAG: tRNA pseudouridine(38-40) synthase TruA [Haloferacaceae archaeon]